MIRLCLVALPLLLLHGRQSVRGCGAAGPPNVRVAIADESAVILWDAASKT